MFKHILVATDGSRLSDKAVDTAIRLAAKLGARLNAFHVTEEYPVTAFPEYAIAYGGLTAEDWEAGQEKRARRILEKVATRAGKAGVDCDTRFKLAMYPHEAIVEQAKKRRCDLIVMASHGRRGLKGLVLGSETHKVLTHGKVPVLVCR